MAQSSRPCEEEDDDVVEVSLWFREMFTLEFLLCGRTGIGKSSLINSLVGREVFGVGDPGMHDDDDEAFERHTTKVQSKLMNLDGVFVKIFDSPGLQDGTNLDEEYLDDMHRNCKGVDLVIYCVDMTTTRYTEGEIQATKLITDKFGAEFWNRCVLVLTKANAVAVPPRERRNKQDYHKRLFSNHLRRFRKQLIKQGVSEEIADGIPAVAAGRYEPDVPDDDPENERYIWYVSDRTTSSDKPVDFLKELWLTCFERTRKVSAQTIFLRATTNVQQPMEADSAEKKILCELLKERDIERKQLLTENEKLKSRLKESQRKALQKLISEYQSSSLPSPPYKGPHRMLDDDDAHRMVVAVERENKRSESSSVAAGAILGAAIGSVGGPLGFVVGGIVGGIFGGIFS